MTRILLKGFYGFGNFGDDILMICIFRIVEKMFPGAEILICSQSSRPFYISRFIPAAKIVTSSDNIQVDWIIHGGGGVFFDFRNGNFLYWLLNSIIELMGYKAYRRFYKAYKSLKGSNYNKSRFRAGLGIGVGSYTASSNRFYDDIFALSSFDILFVRDEQSINNAKKYSVSANIQKFTDLAFLFDYPSKGIAVESGANTIGFILRDWIHNNHVSVLIEVGKKLLSAGHKVKFFSFDEKSDSHYVKSVSDFLPVFCWRPEEMEMGAAFAELSTCQLIVSSRAHGAIVACGLGIPSICVAIEPKLFQVAEMLKMSAVLMQPPFGVDEGYEQVMQTLKNLPALVDATALDRERNRLEMIRGAAEFESLVRHLK